MAAPLPPVECDLQPEPVLCIDADDIINNVQYVHKTGETDGKHASPIDIDVTGSTPIDLPLLRWHNYECVPKKMRLTNSGCSLILSAKWPTGQRPFLTGGPFASAEDEYVFSQMHFHWGANGTEGSEHTVDTNAQPLELHVLHFKRSYLNHQQAATHPDGLCCVCYLFQIRSSHSAELHPIIAALVGIRMAQTSCTIRPFALGRILYPFEYDYFLYWGRCATPTPLLWFVCRHTESLSYEQLCLFRQLLDSRLRPIRRNWRQVCCRNGRQLWHVNAAVQFTNSTMAPVPLRLDPEREVLCPFADDMTDRECRLRRAKWVVADKTE